MNNNSLYCRFYGSVMGCQNGDNCTFSHANPASVPICPYQSNFEGCCEYGDNCCFRHENMMMMKLQKPETQSNKLFNELLKACDLLKDDKSCWNKLNYPLKINHDEMFCNMFVARKYRVGGSKMFRLDSNYLISSILEDGQYYPSIYSIYNYILQSIQTKLDGILIEELQCLYNNDNCKSIIHSIFYDTKSIQQFENFLKTYIYGDAISVQGVVFVVGNSNDNNCKLQMIKKPEYNQYSLTTIKLMDFVYSLRFYDASKQWINALKVRLFDPQRLGLFNEIYGNKDEYFLDELLSEIERVKTSPYRCICKYSFCVFWIDLRIFPNGYMALHDHNGWQWILKTNLYKLGYYKNKGKEIEKGITQWMESYDKSKKNMLNFCINYSKMSTDIIAVIVDFVV